MIDTRIREVLVKHGKLNRDVATLSDHDDLYQAGLASHTSVNVMLALEAGFNIEFPSHALTRSAFSTMASIRALIVPLVPT